MQTKLFTLLLAASCASCGSSGSESLAISAATAADVFHGLTVPPDPGDSANATVAGIDTDSNGVRDDLDRYIAQTYGDNPTKYAAAQLIAKSEQKVVTTNADDINAATAAITANADSGVCLSNKMGDDNAGASKLLNDIILHTYNTRERATQGQSVRATVGQFTRSVDGVNCP